MNEVDFTTFKPGEQTVNHIPNIGRVFGEKTSLIYTLKNKREEIKKNYNLNIDSFLPECYRLDLLSDLKNFLESSTQGVWLKKPLKKLKYKDKYLITRLASFRMRLFLQNEKKLYDFYHSEGVFSEYNQHKFI